MSYDIWLKDPVTREPLEVDEPHLMTGGTYCVGGTRELWLNVTYNYAGRYYRVFGQDGIRTIYGMIGAESMPVLEAPPPSSPTRCPTTIGTRRRATPSARC